MYVCLCRGLTESDIAVAARACARNGIRPEDFIDVLGLRCEDSCGYCEANPQVLLDIYSAEFEQPVASV